MFVFIINQIVKRTMGVFYDIRVHLAENADDYQGKKGSTVSMGIRKVCLRISNIS